MPGSVGNPLQLSPIHSYGPEVVSLIFSSPPTKQNDLPIVRQVTIQDLPAADELEAVIRRLFGRPLEEQGAG